MENTLTRAQLIEIINQPENLRGRKLPVTSRVLSSWESRGAIPYPKRHGVAIGRGCFFLYQASIVDHVKRLIVFLEENRSIDRAILLLWLEGYTVDYRPVLKRGLIAYKKWWDSLRVVRVINEREEVYPSDKAFAIIRKRYQGKEKRYKSKTISAIARRTNKGVFGDYKAVLLGLIIGQDYSSYIEEEVKIFLSLTSGISPASVLDSGIVVEEFFNAISQSCSPAYIEDLIDNGSDQELTVNYLLCSSALDVLLEFPSMRKEIKDYPLIQSNSKERNIIIIVLLAVSVFTQMSKRSDKNNK